MKAILLATSLIALMLPAAHADEKAKAGQSFGFTLVLELSDKARSTLNDKGEAIVVSLPIMETPRRQARNMPMRLDKSTSVMKKCRAQPNQAQLRSPARK